MGSNLKYTVSRCVYDQFSGLNMLISIILDYFGSGIGLVAEHTSSRHFGKCVKHFLRKAFRINRKRFSGDQSCDLPVPDRCILASGCFLHSSVNSFRLLYTVSPVNPVNVK